MIAGAGFGGLATASALRRELSNNEAEIVLVDRQDDFVMGLRKTWAILGMSTLEEGRRRLTDVSGVVFVRGEIERIDPASRSLTVNGREIAGDTLVLALGARQVMDSVPGLAEIGINAWDRGQCERARRAVSAVTRGRILVGIFGMPYACPPGPFELALLARERLPATVEVAIFSPAPIALPVLGAHESAKVERKLGDRDVGWLPRHQATTVTTHTVEFREGDPEPFDVLLAVPQHACPLALIDAGLAQPGGWVESDPATRQTGHDGVYAIGDCTVVPLANGLALPKAGIFAQLQGEVVAARVAARLSGREPTATFDGRGYCFIEMGAGTAARASGSFMGDAVEVAISDATEQGLNDKHEFEGSRLKSWFRA